MVVLTLTFKVYMEWGVVPQRVEKIGWWNMAQFAAIFGPSFQALANQVCVCACVAALRDARQQIFAGQMMEFSLRLSRPFCGVCVCIRPARHGLTVYPLYSSFG